MSRVSIIVPVYNAGIKLERCLESLVNQTEKDIEIIVINDGSTDDSEQIINKYVEKYSEYIKFYSKKNEGVAKTRNFGIEKATSNYIFFVDADDYIDTNTIKKLKPYMDDDVDIIKFKLQRVNEQGEILEKVDGPTFAKTSGQKAFDTLFSEDVLIDSPCVYIMKKELFIQNNFKFKETYHEDFGLIPLILLKAKSFVSLPEYLYYYVQADNSITRNNDYEKTLKRVEDVIKHYDNAIIEINKMNLNKRTDENAKIYYTNALILKMYELKEEDKNKYLAELKKRKLYKNIRSRNLKQLIKKIILKYDINFYLKMRR